MSTVTVIIPNHNHAPVLPRAVRSHLEQTRPPLEVLVVDDCSTDTSITVIEQLCLAYPSVRLIRHTERGGPNAGIASGLKEARGDYVRFAGADDFVDPQFLANSLETLETHPGAALCFTDPSEHDEATGQFRRVPLALADAPAHYTPVEFAALLRRDSFTISSNTTLIRRDAITAIGGFPPKLEWQADWFALLVLAFRHGVCYRPEALAHFTENPRGYGSRGVRSTEGQRRLLFACLDALEGPFSDVRELFREAGCVPEARLRDLRWLMADERGRRFLTPHLARRLIARETWHWLRPLAPAGLRRWMRRQVGRSPASTAR